MKKSLSVLLALMLLALCCAPSLAEGDYHQAPMLDAKVESGELPPVEERLPNNPKLVNESSPEALDYEIGAYGGDLRTVTSSVNWDGDVFIGLTENILNMVDSNSEEITPNLVEDYTVNEDNTVFTFKLRKGLKWSDGEEVTMEDYRFAVENFIFNEELTTIIPANFRAGGSAQGDPMVFEAVDDETFTITFSSAFGGFPVYMSIKGWAGYCDILKPAHYLKQFHKDFAEECHGSLDAYYEFMQPFAAVLGYDDVKADNVWTYVFNSIDMTNWELTNSSAALTSVTYEGLIDDNFPVLYPWVMVSSDNGIMKWERNPYYHKVDAEGNQLPYIDTITSTLVEDTQMVQMKVVAGECDFMRIAATLDNVSLYKENEEKGGFTAYIRTMHTTPTDAVININYGLNADGTVKDDNDSKAWQEVATVLEFRKALAYAIDAEEIVDSVYYGYAEVNTEYSGATYDPDYANQLLDDMGMKDIDGDGYRETPSGLKFQWSIYNTGEATDLVPVSELLVAYWSEIGLHCDVQTIDATLLGTKVAANELPMNMVWIHEGELWHYGDFLIDRWAPLYENWYATGGLSGSATSGLEPTPEVKAFYEVYDTWFTGTPDEAVNVVIPTLRKMNAENYWCLIPITNVCQCLVVNSDIGNVPNDTVNACAEAFVLEQLFFRSAD